MVSDIVSQLRRDEAVRHFPYKDTKGKLTIGIGRNLVSKGLSDSEINVLLVNDIMEFTDQLSAHLEWFKLLDEVRQGVLVNMCFNMGFAGLARFQLFLGHVQAGEWQSAKAEMLNTAWATEVGERATRLAEQIVTGQWM